MFTKYLLVRSEFMRVYIIQVDSEKFSEETFETLISMEEEVQHKENLISSLNRNLVMCNSINTVFT